MKYKKLSNEQIIITLDRLTRFKFTKDKYIRVFGDIISSNLIEPKIKRSDILAMDFKGISSIVSEIFNNSVNSDNSELNLNNYIKDYENYVFNNDNDTQKLLNNTIDYKKAVKYIPKECPVNLKWLKSICECNELSSANYRELRRKNALKYPLEKILLVEGITEEILLPAFSKFLGKDFYKEGIQIIAAGGKNQVVKLYYKLLEEVKLPIFVLLDKDAEDNINQIKPKLRTCDKIHLVSCGEFEDMLPKSLIVKTVNSHFKNFLTISEADLDTASGMVNVLEELFKNKGLHEFKKAEFAKLVKDNISDENDISKEIKSIITEINSAEFSHNTNL